MDGGKEKSSNVGRGGGKRNEGTGKGKGRESERDGTFHPEYSLVSIPENNTLCLVLQNILQTLLAPPNLSSKRKWEEGSK